MKQETSRILDELFATCETLKSTSLSYPNRASILGFLGAAIVANAAGTDVLPYHLDARASGSPQGCPETSRFYGQVCGREPRSKVLGQFINNSLLENYSLAFHRVTIRFIMA